MVPALTRASCRLSVDASQGDFPATRDKQRRYGFTINEATADGLFALDFDAFTIDEIEPHCENGKPPAAIIELPEEMLSTDD